MLSYLLYILRYVFWAFGNLLRKLGNPPDYIILALEESYQELPEIQGGFLQRRLFKKKESLAELTNQFQIIGNDHRVKGVVLHTRPMRMPLSQLETLRDLVSGLRSSGKYVIAWAHTYENSNYYVACAANEILLQPGGFALPLGMQLSFVFLADAFKKIGVKAEFVRVSPYKTAGDQFSRKEMSDEMREMANWLVDDTYENFVDAIAKGRGVDNQTARTLVDQAPFTDLEAIDAGVVDSIISAEDLPRHLEMEGNPAKLATWSSIHRSLLRIPPSPPGKYVALLRIEGDIVDGRSERVPFKLPGPLNLFMNQRAGDISVVGDIHEILIDKRAAAVLVYVDSRGGSANASEAIASALTKLADSKPVVVAMGSVAGSGGYYVSTPSQWIVAQPGTMTGSIGVISGKISNVGLTDRLSIRSESVTRGRHAALFNSDRPFTPEELQIISSSNHRMYQMFLDRVAISRKMSQTEVSAISQGKVWTGSQAIKHRLIDELGGLEQAMRKARELGGLHPRARVRDMTSHTGTSEHPVSHLAMVPEYALRGINIFNRGAPLYMCPLIWDT